MTAEPRQFDNMTPMVESETEQSAPMPREPLPAALLRLVRAKHWLKNVFVIAPALFSERIFELAVARDAIGAFGIFCLVSSTMYIVNDLKDRREDAAHPRKRLRPIASGRISTVTAIAFAASLAAIAVVWAVVEMDRRFLAYMGAYAANTVAYILWLKYRVIVDVIVIACGFVIRLLAGCAAVHVEPSPWLLVCGFSLALVLGFGKRLAEVESPGVSAVHRTTLLAYSRDKLVLVLAACTAVCLMAYMLFTVAPDTVARHGTRNLVYTVPLVAYGLFRYTFKAMEARGDGPTSILFADPVFILCGMLWASAVIAILVWK
jgi:decaprenyl-phosphate phosphoribosyltransferase